MSDDEVIIKELTPEQEKLLDVYKDKWIGIGLKTFQNGDMTKAIELINDIYKNGGLPSGPKVHIWLSSPMAGVIGSYILSKTTDIRQKEEITYDRTRKPNDYRIGEMLDFVIEQMRSQVDIKFDKIKLNGKNREVINEMRGHLHKAGYGLHDASWLSYYNYFLEVCKLECCKELEPLMKFAECGGWWWPYDNAVIFTERPSTIHLDDQGRLHCESDMAISYGDGWGCYFWHGVRMPDWVITNPEKITAKSVDSEENIEVRRVMLERFGVQKYVSESNMIEVQRDRFGVLLRKADDDPENPLTVVLVEDPVPQADGTKGKYIVPVNFNAKTAHEAVASSFRKTVKEYDPDVET